MVIRIYRRRFEAEGYVVDLAVDGELALGCLTRNIPDIVVLDLQLPKVNGVEVLKYIRSNTATTHLPVIVFSNAVFGSLAEEAAKSGATVCRTKASCTPQELVELIRTTLGIVSSPSAVKV